MTPYLINVGIGLAGFAIGWCCKQSYLERLVAALMCEVGELNRERNER